ncbi:MAG TPA: sigma-54 dependent transcriptional regulator, partial [Longimicrobium sp.]|nr:sigma-54 dependent transcriptional regulator [Longimicrobium sp.]
MPMTAERTVTASPAERTQARPDPLAGAGPQANADIRVLVVEDELTLRESCVSVLAHAGFDVSGTGRGDEARELLSRRRWDLVILDLYMGSVSGMELLRLCLEKSPETLVVVMTGNPSVESSIEALRAGAWDYLPKPFTAQHLQVLCGRAAHTVHVARESRAERGERQARNGHSDKVTLLGRSPAFLQAVELARKVAATDASVFITGESGTGKELVARAIHVGSHRSSAVFLPYNCTTTTRELADSQLFGHRRGSFTGAVTDQPGLIRSAGGGTLFLDEIGDLPLDVQPKLLRFLEQGEVMPVGETRPQGVDVRILAATNADLEQRVTEGKFRED